MRAVALLGLHTKPEQVKPFELAGANIFTGNELDPSDQPEAALIFGGDGTLHRHLAVLSRNKIPTLVVPLGSANDFAQSIGIESVGSALAAWRHFCATRRTRAIDLGTISALAENKANDSSPAPPWQGESLETMHFVPDGPRHDLPRMGPRIEHSQTHRWGEAQDEAHRVTYYSCIAGTGLDAAVNRRTLKQSRWLRGHGGYIAALFQVLGGFRVPHVTVDAEVDGQWRTVIDEEGFLVAAGNGPQYGHGMRLTHEARMDDGLLDVCFVRKLGKLRLLRLFPVVFRGAHIGLKEVEYFRAQRVRLHTDPIMEVFADGEYICRTPVEMGIAREALQVIVPP